MAILPSVRPWLCRLFPVVCPICFCGCIPPDRSAANRPEDGAELPILRQHVYSDSHELRRLQVVVRTPEELATLPIAQPAIDFEREMALVVTLGRVSSVQYAVRVTRVWRAGSNLQVEVAVQRPPAGASLAQAAPYCIAVVPRCDLNVADFSVPPPAGSAPPGARDRRRPGFGLR